MKPTAVLPESQVKTEVSNLEEQKHNLTQGIEEAQKELAQVRNLISAAYTQRDIEREKIKDKIDTLVLIREKLLEEAQLEIDTRKIDFEEKCRQADQALQIREMELTTTKRDLELLEERLKKYETELKEADTTLQDNNKEYAARESALSEKESWSMKKEVELVAREQELDRVESDIKTRKYDLAVKETDISSREGDVLLMMKDNEKQSEKLKGLIDQFDSRFKSIRKREHDLQVREMKLEDVSLTPTF